jgi:hypothetical protein
VNSYCDGLIGQDSSHAWFGPALVCPPASAQVRFAARLDATVVVIIFLLYFLAPVAAHSPTGILYTRNMHSCSPLTCDIIHTCITFRPPY